jgi:hypothetical protein
MLRSLEPEASMEPSQLKPSAYTLREWPSSSGSCVYRALPRGALSPRSAMMNALLVVLRENMRCKWCGTYPLAFTMP